MLTSPETVVVGPQGSHRIQIYVSGDVHIFNVLLQPAALNRLIGIDMTSLVNEGLSAHDVLGKRAVGLNNTVRSAPDFASRVAAAERWFGNLMENSGPADGIDLASRLLLMTAPAAFRRATASAYCDGRQSLARRGNAGPHRLVAIRVTLAVDLDLPAVLIGLVERLTEGKHDLLVVSCRLRA